MPRAQDYAIVIGINDYTDINTLAGPIADAEAFRDWLLLPTGGDIPSAANGRMNVYLITSQKTPPRPIKDDVDDCIRDIIQQNPQGGLQRFYFYFAGHGLGKDWNESGLCLPKWSKDYKNNALSSSLYLTEILHWGYFQEVFFFLDCCRDIVYSANPLGPNFGWPPRSPVAQNFVAFACEFDNAAYEAMGNVVKQEGVRGHFTKALVQALSGAASDENGNVTTNSIKGYLKAAVSQIAAQHDQQQTVKCNDNFDLETIIVHGHVVLVKTTITFSQDGDFILEDPRLKVLKKGNRASGPWVLDLAKGTYTVRNKDSSILENFRIEGTENQFDYEL